MTRIDFLFGALVAASLPAQNAFEPGPKTPPSYGHALAFDSGRGEIVLFGGDRYEDVYVPASTDETWVFDGRWEERPTAVRPSARTGHALAHHASRGETVLFGSDPAAETWVWDGSSWTLRNPAQAPPPRDNPALAYDSVRDRVVLFGGTGATSFDDTWEWDGIDWVARTPANRPPAGAAVMAFDAGRGVCVAVTGADRTWEYDGVDWTERAPVPSFPLLWHTIAYDAARGRCVLARGHAGLPDPEVQEWDGTSWTPVRPANMPRVAAPKLVYDAARAQCALFGGRTASVPFHPNSLALDLYHWDGIRWTRWEPRQFPEPTRGHAMAYDAMRAETVVFGGRNIATLEILDDTWVWNGSEWRSREPATRPSPRRYGHALAYDSTRARTLLFGGHTPWAPTDETWVWNGTTWTRLTPAASPPARHGHAMTYDPVRDEIVLFGGHDGQTDLFDTWVFDSSTWERRITAASPSVTGILAMTWDARRERVVLVQDDAFWEWNGADWTLVELGAGVAHPSLSFDSTRGVGYVWDGESIWAWTGVEATHMQTLVTSFPPPIRRGFTSVYDEARDRVVIFGAAQAGSSFPALRAFTQTWLYEPGEPALFGTYGSGCSGTGGVPGLGMQAGSAPVPGTVLTIEVSGLPPSRLQVPCIVLGFSRPPAMDLTAIGMPGCQLLTSHEFDTALLNLGGAAVWPLGIPANPTLPGLHFYVQCFVADSGANALGVTSSDAGEVRIGSIVPR